jgi:hypothetical protein
MVPGEREEIEQWLPGLRGKEWQITSPEDDRYNCLAWALEETTRVWSPRPDGYTWPSDVPRDNAISSYQALFATFGYAATQDETLEVGQEKVALFARQEPEHVARQLSSGAWTSKLGQSHDITHPLRAIEGDLYGSIVLVMARRNQPRA